MVISLPSGSMCDDFVKSPDAALRYTPRHCGVPKSTPHSSGLARLACELFTKPSLMALAGAIRETPPALNCRKRLTCRFIPTNVKVALTSLTCSRRWGRETRGWPVRPATRSNQRGSWRLFALTPGPPFWIVWKERSVRTSFDEVVKIDEAVKTPIPPPPVGGAGGEVGGLNIRYIDYYHPHPFPLPSRERGFFYFYRTIKIK